MSLRPGEILANRYEVLRLLGQGAMGTVYQAHDRVLDDTVALKVLDDPAASQAALRFRSEIKLARKVAHPNVCRIYEYGEDGARRFIAMEFVDGRTVKDLLRERGPFPIVEACGLVLQAAEALQAIHDAGVIHRDLKTLNLMQDGAGRLRVMDFGIAKPRGSTGVVPPHGYTLGTPEYMSPEQARGLALDHRSDLYSLGIVLFELLTGDVPFRGDNPTEILSRQMHEPPPLEEGGSPAATIPAALLPVLARALAKRADDRYGSARELAEALRGLLVSPLEDTRPRAISLGGATLTLTQPHLRRARWIEPWLGLAAVLVLVSAVFWMAGRGAVPLVSPHAASVAATRPPGRPDGHGVLPLARERARRPPHPGSGLAPVPVVPARDRGASSLVPAGHDFSFLATAASADEVSHVDPVADAAPAGVDTEAVAPASPSATALDGPGQLRLGIHPWAFVTVDGANLGSTPMKPLTLAAGAHIVRLFHPDYGYVVRWVVIQPGQTTVLQVNIKQMGTPDPPLLHAR